jgi:hypothetical protein
MPLRFPQQGFRDDAKADEGKGSCSRQPTTRQTTQTTRYTTACAARARSDLPCVAIAHMHASAKP